MLSGSKTGSESTKLMHAIRHVLRPLVRLMLSQGLTYSWIAELLKSIYVEVAERDFALGSARSTDSRISLLTGVHRKDVKRLRVEAIETEDVTPPAISLGAQLVARWVSDSRYTDADGNPQRLARLASVGGERSFEALVASVSKDIRARAVLDEWLRLQVAHVDDEDYVHLNVDAFVPVEGFEEKVFYFGQNLHDHMAAATQNVVGGSPSFVERSVHYDTLSEDSVNELAKLVERAGMTALKTVNRRAATLSEQDAKSAQSSQRMNFGIYFYREPMHDKTPDK